MAGRRLDSAPEAVQQVATFSFLILYIYIYVYIYTERERERERERKKLVKAPLDMMAGRRLDSAPEAVQQVATFITLEPRVIQKSMCLK